VRTLKLAYGVEPRAPRPDNSKDYKVVVVKNSVQFHPGQILSKDETDRLCQSPVWDVTVVRYNPEMDR
jgi:hypothetical protein